MPIEQNPWEYGQPQQFPSSPYPVTSMANALANIVNTWSAQKEKDKYTKALAGALAPQPVDNVGITPQITGPGQFQQREMSGAYNQPTERDVFSKLLDTGNSDVTAQFAPLALQSQIQSQAQANAPITPYQRANLFREQQATTATIANQDAARKAQADALAEQIRTHDPKYLASVKGAEAQAEFPYQQKLAQTKADAAAAQAGLFGRGMEGRSYNILAKGLTDEAYRSTPEYLTAWQIASNPKVDPSTGTVVVPDLSNFKPPGPLQGQPQGAPGVPGAAPQMGAAGQQRMPSVQSFAPPNPSQAEAASAGYANRLNAANKLFDNPDIEAAGSSYKANAAAGVPVFGNQLAGSSYQQFDQAARNFINAQLRRESGAVISPSEFADARKQYLPQPGDGPDVKAQKKANRDMAVKNMQLSAGNTLLPPGGIQQASPAKGSPVVPMSQEFAPPNGQSSPSVQDLVDEAKRRGLVK
jgi:hypothetical protein